MGSMFLSKKSGQTSEKEKIIKMYRTHVSSGKVDFFKKYGMDFVMGRREGPYLWDMEGEKRLFNCHCNGGVFNLGHRHQELIKILRESLDEYDIGNHHLISRMRAELAHALANLMPGDLKYTVFGVGGGEAIDLAIKVARAFTGKTNIISAHGGYHGHTGLALAAGDARYRTPFGPSTPGFKQVHFGDSDSLAAVVSDDTAAVIMETIPATLGIVVPEKAYLQEVRNICNRNNVLLILDEVQSGLGRTGKLWAFEHYDIIPDIVVLGKGLSGGLYPISATVLREELESVFHKDPFIHISTFGGAEIGCTVAQRVLKISSDKIFLAHVNTLAERFADGVKVLQNKHPKYLIGLHQLGLMMGLKCSDEFCGPVLTKTAYNNDLLLVYANNDPSVCQFLPPLVMELEQVDLVIKKLDKALAAARQLKPILKMKHKFF
jgi:acetylornithine/succinyldiaminopimelate/putrescine aminotransferase